MLLAVGGCGVAFLVVLGAVALLPADVREALPDGLVGGAVLVLGTAVVVGARRAAAPRRARPGRQAAR
ncbi:hypothetical protein [Streptomyces bambusae]|uniref:Uncharacterized protein n=1 Tax=Streptomyces bambusae TaxID=1550616 RepID=A0ABS6ZAG4_9ACTN|nr:hypothetical protein [Streptomyces bambusae]MBW5484735.1 hypothetical protein [Streptomyces bambusae]